MLPIVDITSPVFTVTATDAELDRLTAQFIEESRKRQRLPRFIERALVRFFLRSSKAGRGLLAASGTYLTGLNTYRLKLGPENLGADAGPVDRRIAASLPAIATRLRLQDVARLLAEALAARLSSAAPDRPLLLLNIAGGPAADSWNAAILLKADRGAALGRRRIQIAVLDIDQEGASFGARAVRALAADGGPLQDAAIDFRRMPFDWRKDADLVQRLAELGAGEALCGMSSEGGLFEYGSDAEIVANLERLHAGTPSDAVVAGSVTRDDEPARIAKSVGHAATRLRSIEAFRALAAKAGWSDDRVLARPFSYNVRLVKAH